VNNDSSGVISVTELKEVLRAFGVFVDGEDGDKFFEQLPDVQSRVIPFDELKHNLTQRMIYRVQAGRHYQYGVLSLFEAECMRALLHQQSALPLIPGTDASVALRTRNDARHFARIRSSAKLP